MKHFVFLKIFLFTSFLFLSCGGSEPEEQASSDQPSTGEPPPSIPQIPNVISPDEIDELWGDTASPFSSVPPSWGGPPSFTVTSRSQVQRNTSGTNNRGQQAPTGSGATSERGTGREIVERPAGGQRRMTVLNQNLSNADGELTRSSRQQIPWKGIKTTYYCRLTLGPRYYITYEPGRLDPNIACEFDAVQPWRGPCQQRLSQQGWRIFNPDEECDHPVDFIDCNGAWQVLRINPSKICALTDRVEYSSDEENPLPPSDRRGTTTTGQESSQENRQQEEQQESAASSNQLAAEESSGNAEAEETSAKPRWAIEEPSALSPHSPIAEDEVF